MAATGTALVNNRSAGIDYYGNILMGGYADHLVHMICLNASPLCVSGAPAPTAANPLQIEIGYMGLVRAAPAALEAAAQLAQALKIHLVSRIQIILWPHSKTADLVQSLWAK